MKLIDMAVFALALLVSPSLVIGQPVITTSSFETDTEGWMVQSLDGGDYSILYSCPEVSGCIYQPVYMKPGGHPGGCLFTADSTSDAEFWRAPDAFITGAAFAYGGELRFDIRSGLAPGGGEVAYDIDHDVILADTSVTNTRLYFDLVFPTQGVWTTQQVPFYETAGWVNESTGMAPTQFEMMAVLGNLDHMWILGEYYRPGFDSTQLDNVFLYGPEPIPVEPSSWGDVKTLYR